MARVVALAIVLAACWRGAEPEASEPEPPVPRQKGATCDEVAVNARKVLVAATDKELAARADPIGSIVNRRCDEDAWSVELRRCVAGAATVDDTTICRKLATKQQHDRFEHELEVFEVSE